MTLAYIGLGSNLADPQAQVTLALRELAQLPHTRLLAQSRLYISAPVGPAQPDFINAAALLETQLAPLALLDALQQIERDHQRVRLQHWGPRTLDLDLLLYGEQTIDCERLSVPHPFLTQRSFVLYPLADINPQLQLPDGTSLQFLLQNCPATGLAALAEQ